MDQVKFKVAFIGAGSIEYTEKLLYDILSVPEFSNIEITFHDVSAERLERSRAICQKDIDDNGLSIRIVATTDLAEAVKDAKYVVNMIKVGGIRAWEYDMMIPLSYGVDQCVGDTLGAGGIMYGMRTMPVILDICEKMRAHAHPDALFVNVANPLTMNTWAATKYGKVKAVGLCHGVWLGHKQFESVFQIPVDDIYITCLGVNHLGFYTGVRTKEKDLKPLLPEGYRKHPVFKDMEKVRIDMMDWFLDYCTESNGHTTDLVPWYRNQAKEIKDWVAYNNPFCGESNGYLNWARGRQAGADDVFQKKMGETAAKFDRTKRSPEHASRIMEGIELNRIYRGHFNVPNNGSIKNFEDETIVEVPCYADAFGINVPIFGEMDTAQAEVINRIAVVNKLAADASCTGDVKKLYQAMLLDPLTGAKLGTRQIRQMTDELLAAEEEWLPQFKEGVREAKERLAESKANGTYIPVDKDYRGDTERDFPFGTPQYY